ncbi:terminase gpA endonuclease subunit [Aminobacterium sp. EBM-42]|uniref:terminase gpA endonuclease subunit n=1 Tax=Aminobacterium sp. EBM-42 TaxID=1918503 RepID=UPI000AC11432|nr:terminase gpA endonuclease subunit [Aminobacterium sp. EBM-42]
MLPNWSYQEISVARPPERMSVSEWADRFRVLDRRISAKPGPWRTSFTPYLKDVMDYWTNPEVEEIVICKAAQSGGTEAALNCLGYSIDQDPSSALIVYPSLEIAEWTSENRIQPMVEASSRLREKFLHNESDRLELQFPGMYLVLAGANSPASLASRPVRYLIFDEIDKYPPFSGKEASPLKLGKERTKSFSSNRKILYISTPTLSNKGIWLYMRSSDLILHYYVPCPHCGQLQKLSFSQIKWAEYLTEKYDKLGDNLEERRSLEQKIRDSAWYECEHCKKTIYDKDKPEMLLKGKWLPKEKATGPVRRVAFHWNSLYAPMLTFGDVAAEFISSKNLPETLMNFINSWLAEPWEEKATALKSDIVLKAAWTHSRGIVPNNALVLTAGVDIQKGHMFYVIRAWGERLTSWLVDYGRCENWQEVEDVIVNRQYKAEDGGISFQVKLAMIDSGYRTDEVYDFCAIFSDVCKPVKGSSKPLRAPYSISSIDKDEIGGLKLWIADGDYYKSLIHGRLRKKPGSYGSWMIFKNCSREYADQICAERKITLYDQRTKRTRQSWEPISQHAQNHLLDAEVYAAVAADVLGVRYLVAEDEISSEAYTQQTQEETTDTEEWIPRTEGWLRV